MQSQRKLTNWLATWLTLYEGTGLPRSFAMWSGISLLASVIQDNCVLKEQSSVLKPNMYMWFIGPTGAGKSESAKPAIELYQQIPFMEMYEGSLTGIYLYKYMENIQQKRALNSPTIANPRLLIYSDELADTLGTGPLAEQLMRSFTVMYNRSYKYGTGTHGLIEIENPVLNWLACTTPAWLKRAVPKDMLDSGFVSRIISIYEPLGQRRKHGVSDDPDIWAMLTHDILHISQLQGEFSLTPEAQRLRDIWADEQWDARLKQDEITQGIFGREEEHTLKVAMALSISARDDLLITERGFFNAATHVLNARSSSLDVLRSIAMTPQIELKVYMYNYIKRAAPIEHSKLRSRLYHKIEDTNQFHRLINALSAEGLIRISTNATGAQVYDVPINNPNTT